MDWKLRIPLLLLLQAAGGWCIRRLAAFTQEQGVGLMLQVAIWVGSPRLLPFWHLVLEDGGLDTTHIFQRPAKSATLFQEDLTPLLHHSLQKLQKFVAAKAAGQNSGNGVAPGHRGQRICYSLLISHFYLSNWLGQTEFLPDSLSEPVRLGM